MQHILDSMNKYFETNSFTQYAPGTRSELWEMAKSLALMRIAGEDRSGVPEQVKDIAQQHASTLTIPEKQAHWHLLRIAHHFAALAELFGIDLLPLVRPLLLKGLREFAELKPTYSLFGPDFVERSAGARGMTLACYCQISHLALVDISPQIAAWRAAVVQHLERGRKGEEYTAEGERWENSFQAEMAIIDGMIFDYKPMPGSQPL